MITNYNDEPESKPRIEQSPPDEPEPQLLDVDSKADAYHLSCSSDPELVRQNYDFKCSVPHTEIVAANPEPAFASELARQNAAYQT